MPTKQHVWGEYNTFAKGETSQTFRGTERVVVVVVVVAYLIPLLKTKFYNLSPFLQQQSVQRARCGQLSKQ